MACDVSPVAMFHIYVQHTCKPWLSQPLQDSPGSVECTHQKPQGLLCRTKARDGPPHWRSCCLRTSQIKILSSRGTKNRSWLGRGASSDWASQYESHESLFWQSLLAERLWLASLTDVSTGCGAQIKHLGRSREMLGRENHQRTSAMFSGD